MPRLGYLKSRHGCDRCKQRRVKCDECSPCAACVRHGIRCSLLDRPVRMQLRSIRDNRDPRMEAYGSPPEERGTIGGRGNRRLIPAQTEAGGPSNKPKFSIVPDEHLPRIVSASSVSASEEDHENSLTTGFTTDPYPYLLPLLSQSETPGIPAWMSDLELMHHFTASTWQTLPRANEIQRIWQIEIPRLALEYEFLMHQLLCISASHLVSVHHNESKKYTPLATHHQNNAIKGLRRVLPNIDSVNCHAVFVAASLLIISAFAASSDHHEPKTQPGIDHLLEVFYLMRGMNQILHSHEQLLMQSSIGGLLQLSEYRSATPFLMSIVAGITSAMLPHSEQGLSQSAPCQDAATTLIHWISRAAQDAPVPEQRLVSSWPIAVSNEFMELMRERHGGAMVLLSYYCQIVEHVEPECWYLSGWAKSVQREIERTSNS
ncbi:hypothetical protein F5X99DRAFT_326986 [Biscogniauxia marginata]|nr:hypothetical protein F5X99DRAFT_326986 [Biscogniauxia marginata]